MLNWFQRREPKVYQNTKSRGELGEVSGNREDLLLQRQIVAHKLSCYKDHKHMTRRS